MRRRRVRVGVLGVTAAFAGLAVPPAGTPVAATSPPQDDAAPATLVTVTETYALAPGDPWTARFELTDPVVADAMVADDTGATTEVTGEVVIRVHGRIDDREALAAVLDGGPLPAATDGITVDLADGLSVDESGITHLDVSVPTDTGRGPGALTLSRPGISLVTVTVHVDGGSTTTHRTFVRRLPAEPTTQPPLAIAITAALGDPGPNPNTATLERHRTELEQLAAFGAATDAAVSLALPPSLGAVLDGDELLRAAVADALDRTELLSLPLLTLDPSAAAGIDQMARFASEVRQGEDTLTRLFPGAAARRSAWLVEDTISGPAAAALRDPLGYRLLVLDQTSYERLPGSIGGFLDTQRLVAASPGPDEQSVAAAVVDPASALLAADDRAPLERAVELLTRLLVAREDLGTRDRRTAVLALDEFALPDAATVDALATLVADQPDVRLVTLSEVPARTDFMRVGADITRVELPDDAGDRLDERLERIALLRVATESAGSMLPTADRRNTWQNELDGLISTGLSDETVTRTLDRIGAEVDAVLASVDPPESLSFTLTGRRSELRINVRNNADEPRVVRVRPTSPKLRFPEGDQTVTLEPGSNEIVIPVEARSNGTSSVEIQLLTPVFDRPLGPPAILEARVNALTGLGPVVTGFAILLLGSWWFSHYRRRRKQRLADETPATGLVLGEAVSPDAAEAAVARPVDRDTTGNLPHP